MSKPVAAVSLVLMEDGEIGFSKSENCTDDILETFARRLMAELSITIKGSAFKKRKKLTKIALQAVNMYEIGGKLYELMEVE